MGQDFQMVAKTFAGLEDVLCDELLALGARNVETGKRQVTFEGDLELLYKANLSLRTALCILKPIAKFTADSTDELYDRIRDMEWEQYMTVDSTFLVDATVHGNAFNHSQYVTYRVKDAIVDHFVDLYKERPSIQLTNPDLRINVHISDNRVTLSFDSSGEKLYKRGYRLESVKAPINEVLAAGIILKSGWRGDCDFVDPMCGSGTFLIEAALIAANINPGIYRKNFAFEKWADFDEELFERIYNDDSEEREFHHKIYGGDINPEAVRIARRNIRAAGPDIEQMIDLRCEDFLNWKAPSDAGIMVTNPPYGERLRPDDISALYEGIGSTLKNRFPGWNVWIIAYNDDNFVKIGLKPSLRYKLYNGELECEVREYVLFDGKYNDFRGSGGKIKHEKRVRKEDTQKKSIKRLSDKEWNADAKKINKSFRSERKKSRDERDSKHRREFGKSDKLSSFERKDWKRDDSGKRDWKRGDSFRKERTERHADNDRREKRVGRPYGVIDKGPKLPESSATKFSDSVAMRSRRKKKQDNPEN